VSCVFSSFVVCVLFATVFCMCKRKGKHDISVSFSMSGVGRIPNDACCKSIVCRVSCVYFATFVWVCERKMTCVRDSLMQGWDVFQTMLVGSLSHLAPEQVLGTVYSGEKIDMWSVGVILYIMITGVVSCVRVFCNCFVFERERAKKRMCGPMVSVSVWCYMCCVRVLCNYVLCKYVLCAGETECVCLRLRLRLRELLSVLCRLVETNALDYRHGRCSYTRGCILIHIYICNALYI